MRRTASFFIGVMLGSLIGSIVAMLFAPSSGNELRAKIHDRADIFTAEIRQAATSKRIELQERLESLRSPRS